jgi:phage baseplate assembly protein W
VDVLSFPFRVTSTGQIATVLQLSDADVAQKIASLLQTELGELPLAPHFGVADPTFRDVTPTEIQAAVAAFFPEVIIDGITVGVDGRGESAIEIFFDTVVEE